MIFYLGRTVKDVPRPPADPAWRELSKKARGEKVRAWKVSALRELFAKEGPRAHVLVTQAILKALPKEIYEEVFPGPRIFMGHDKGAHLIRGREMGHQPGD